MTKNLTGGGQSKALTLSDTNLIFKTLKAVNKQTGELQEFFVYDEQAVHADDLANNLITTATGFALDARQGKTLSDLINTKQDTLFAPLFCVNRNVSDWDDITQIGWYSGNYAANAPTTGWLNVMVLASNANPNYLVAVAFSFGVSSGSIYGRVRNEGTWRDWYKPT